MLHLPNLDAEVTTTLNVNVSTGPLTTRIFTYHSLTITFNYEY